MKLPSTTALKAFDATARLLSFTAAAAELAQTQGAVSHQIRELEERLGAQLFTRKARRITLTEAGHTYLVFVREALERLRAGARAVQPGSPNQVLTVSCSPNFAHKWLVPRLGSFLADNPAIDLRISASMRHVSFQDDGIDIALRHGDGQWPGLTVTKLCKEFIFPVCSPHLTAVKSIKHIDDLHSYTLLHDAQREGWASWLRSANVNPEEFDLHRGPILNQTSLVIDAAVAAQGIALARSALVELDLQAGRLIKPVLHEILAPFAYWIVCPEDHQSRPNILRFKSWLLAQTQMLS